MIYLHLVEKIKDILSEKGRISYNDILRICKNQILKQIVQDILVKQGIAEEKTGFLQYRGNYFVDGNSKFDVFVSYAHEDNKMGKIDLLVNEIMVRYFQKSGETLNIFYDKAHLRSGDKWRQNILEALKNSSILIVILSPSYFSSKFCEEEFNHFISQNEKWATKSTIPVYAVKSPQLFGENDRLNLWKQYLRDTQYLDITDWFEAGEKHMQTEVIRQRVLEIDNSIYSLLTLARTLKQNSQKHNIPSLSSELIIRSELLKSIDKNLIRKNPNIICLYGLPGMGKSTLAFTYARNHLQNYKGGCWYVSASTVDQALLAIIQELKYALSLPFSEEEEVSIEKAFTKIRSHFSEVGSDDENFMTLFILDNIKQIPSSFRKSYLSKLLPSNSHVIITSREQQNNHEIENIQVDQLELQDSLQLLQMYHPWDTEDTELHKSVLDIASHLNGFVLGLIMVGSFLRNENLQDLKRITYKDIMLELTRKGFLGISSTLDTGSLPNDYQFSLARHFLFSLCSRLDDFEVYVLTIASQFTIDSIPLIWVRDIVRKSYPEKFISNSPLVPSPWDEAVRMFLRLSLWQKDFDTRCFRMHRVVQESFVANSDTDLTSEAVIGIVDRANVMLASWNHSEHDYELKSILQLFDFAKKSTDSLFISLGLKIASILNMLGRYRLAEITLLDSIKIIESTNSFELNYLNAHYYNLLSQTQYLIRKYTDARKNILKAIGSAEISKKLDSTQGIFLLNLINIEEAISSNFPVEDVRMIATSLIQPEQQTSPHMQSLLQQELAFKDLKTNDYSAAIDKFLKAIKLIDSHPSERMLLIQLHLQVASIFTNINEVERANLHLNEAEKLILLATPDGNRIWELYFQRSKVYLKKGFQKEAYTNCKTAMKIIKEEFGSGNLSYADCLELEAEILDSEGKDYSVPIEEAIRIRSKLPNQLQSISQLALGSKLIVDTFSKIQGDYSMDKKNSPSFWKKLFKRNTKNGK